MVFMIFQLLELAGAAIHTITSILHFRAFEFVLRFCHNVTAAVRSEAKRFVAVLAMAMVGSYTAVCATERAGLIRPRRIFRWIVPGTCGLVAGVVSFHMGQRRALVHAVQATIKAE
jgi:hypothetical protein